MNCKACGHKTRDHDERGEPMGCQIPGCPCRECIVFPRKEHPFYKHYVARAKEFKEKYGKILMFVEDCSGEVMVTEQYDKNFILRYSPNCYDGWCKMDPDTHGDWVEYDDYRAVVDQLRAILEERDKEIKRLREQKNRYFGDKELAQQMLAERNEDYRLRDLEVMKFRAEVEQLVKDRAFFADRCVELRTEIERLTNLNTNKIKE